MSEAKSRICGLLHEIDKLLTEYASIIPAASMGQFHVRRAMELMMCSPEKPTMGEKELELYRRGIIVE
jgi:hypothetical protein